jgi:hypothetical protein
MRYFVPDIRLAEELPAQAAMQDKLGGRPWGLPLDRWPECADCGKSQSLLAQFSHHAERLDLGREGRVLHLFQCNHDPGMCQTWEGGAGANACFVTEPEDMWAGLTPLPGDAPVVEREVRILAWVAREDGISPEQESAFYSDGAYFKLPREITDRVGTITKLKGLPFWIQSPSEAPAAEDGWQFAGQLDSAYSFLQAPAKPTQGVVPETDGWEGRSHVCEGPNFGDGGIGYIFLRKAEDGVVHGHFFWQCG